MIRDMIALVEEKDEGFYEYTWTKPEREGEGFPKIAFVKRFARSTGSSGPESTSTIWNGRSVEKCSNGSGRSG